MRRKSPVYTCDRYLADNVREAVAEEFQNAPEIEDMGVADLRAVRAMLAGMKREAKADTSGGRRWQMSVAFEIAGYDAALKWIDWKKRRLEALARLQIEMEFMSHVSRSSARGVHAA